MSAYLYAVRLPLLCLSSCIMPAQLYNVCWPIWCLTTWMKSAYMYDVCSNVWCLHKCIMPYVLYDVCSTIWFACLYDRLLNGLMSACLFYVCSSAYLYDVWITVLCLTSCMMYGKLYDVCLPVWCLLYCMSVFLNDVFLTVWWLFLPFPLENSNVNNIIMKTETFQYQSLGSKWNENVAVCLRNVYTETKMFRFSPNVSISKQKHLDLVQNFLYRNKNLSFTPTSIPLCLWW